MRSIHTNGTMAARLDRDASSAIGLTAPNDTATPISASPPDTELIVHFTLRHSKPSPTLEAYANNAVSEFKKVFDRVTTVQVILDHQKNDYVRNKLAEIKVVAIGHTFISKEQAETYEKAIDACVSAMKRQLQKHKEKQRGL